MDNKQYELLKAEIPGMAEQVKLFPEELQEKVFDLLVSTFLGHASEIYVQDQDNEVTTEIQSDGDVNPIPEEPKSTNIVEAFKNFINKIDPNGDLTGMEFAAAAAYFYLYEAPNDKRANEINKEMLADANRYADRKPFNAPSTLTNARLC